MRLGKFFVLILLIVLADQVSKQLIQHYFAYGNQRPLIPGLFSLSITYNTGVAFGLLSDLNEVSRNLIIYAFNLAAIFALIILYALYYQESSTHSQAVAFILGGAFGNLIDRLTIGKVIDFLDFYLMDYHWPAFNIADACICIGVFMLVFIKD
jgi:signal peptidase II